ncbi:MAG: efflux RND transporter periplasmic adaptor subunit [bacterium]|jgi:membrane fusion protein (multidrug efflux system)
MKKNLFPLLFATIFFSCTDKKESTKSTGPQNNGPLPVEAIIIKTSSQSENIQVGGTILPFEITEIRSEISGRVIQINFKEGAMVQQGVILIKLFDDDLQAQLKKLQVQLKIAEKTEERQRELLKISGISQQDYDLSLLQVNNLKADIEMTMVSIGKTEIRAPYNGRMGLRNISLGAYITPTNIISTISQLNKKKISFSIPEKYGGEVKPGMNVSFTIDGNNNILHATVFATETIVESETRNLKIIATINDADNKLIPGRFASVNLVLGKTESAIMVPSQAIIPGARSKQVILFKNGSPSYVTVQTGLRNVDEVQIKEGVNPGDTLVTTGLLFIRKDSKLKLTSVK